jgi:hypothetical protein
VDGILGGTCRSAIPRPQRSGFESMIQAPSCPIHELTFVSWPLVVLDVESCAGSGAKTSGSAIHRQPEATTARRMGLIASPSMHFWCCRSCLSCDHLRPFARAVEGRHYWWIRVGIELRSLDAIAEGLVQAHLSPSEIAPTTQKSWSDVG